LCYVVIKICKKAKRDDLTLSKSKESVRACREKQKLEQQRQRDIGLEIEKK